jgi:hypothetical protein
MLAFEQGRKFPMLIKSMIINNRVRRTHIKVLEYREELLKSTEIDRQTLTTANCILMRIHIKQSILPEEEIASGTIDASLSLII